MRTSHALPVTLDIAKPASFSVSRRWISISATASIALSLADAVSSRQWSHGAASANDPEQDHYDSQYQ